MMDKVNCWEYMKCGREPNGENVDTCGICPAAASLSHDGINDGVNVGRFCWVVAGTYCESKVQGQFADKLIDCLHCKFFKSVNEEEGRYFKMLPDTRNGNSFK